MNDMVIKGTGNSRFLKSNIAANITFQEFVDMLRAGTLPIDFNGLNSAGIDVQGTPLNTATLLPQETRDKFWLGSSAFPKDALDSLALLTGADDPTPATQGALGQCYLNTTTNAIFKCRGRAGSLIHLYLWEEISNVVVKDITTEISNAITKTSGNSTLAVTTAVMHGKVVEIGFHISVTGNVAAGENIFVGTLADYRPMAYISTASYYGTATPSAGVLRISGSGDIVFRLVSGALSNGAEMYCGLTYITE